MMKRIFIVVEGQTEQEFVRNILGPYFYLNGILSVTPILIRTSKIGRGGHVNAQHLMNTIKALLSSKKDDFVVSTFVDFFRIPSNMPEYEKCMLLGNDSLRVAALESALGRAIADRRFLPYIQMHEFEALLFSNNSGFEDYFSVEQARKTAAIISMFENPEDINSSPETAPSKRILSIDEGYQKVLLGNLIALDVGIDDMLSKCPRFSFWIHCLLACVSGKSSGRFI